LGSANTWVVFGDDDDHDPDPDPEHRHRHQLRRRDVAGRIAGRIAGRMPTRSHHRWRGVSGPLKRDSATSRAVRHRLSPTSNSTSRTNGPIAFLQIALAARARNHPPRLATIERIRSPTDSTQAAASLTWLI
jgi:hypothetical protein